MTNKKSKKAIIVDENLTWRYAASYILESANFSVTPIRRHALKHCLLKNAAQLQLALIRVDALSSIQELRDIITLCQTHNICTVLTIGTVRLAILQLLHQLKPNAIIVQNNAEQLIAAFEHFNRHQNYLAPALKHAVDQYCYLQTSPANKLTRPMPDLLREQRSTLPTIH